MPEAAVHEEIESPPPSKARRASARVIEKAEAEDTRTVVEWMKEFAPAQDSVKVSIIRQRPSEYRGVHIKGNLETVDGLIDEDYLKERWGGGVYKIQVKMPDAQGRYVYAGQRTVEIAGLPKLGGLAEEPEEDEPRSSATPAPRESETAIHHLGGVTKALLESRQNSGMDEGLRLMIGTLQNTVADLQRQMAAKDEKLLDIVQNPQTRTTDVLLEKMIDTDSARIAAVRAQHESEVRALRERHGIELDRLHAHYSQSMTRVEDNHKREIDMLRQNYDAQIAIMGQTHAAQVDSYKRELATLESSLGREIKALMNQLETARKEVEELRSKKDRTIVEQMKELASVREAFDMFGGGSDDDEPKSAIGQIAERFTPLIEGIAARIAEPPTPPAPAPTPGLAPPQGQLYRMPDGSIVNANGQPVAGPNGQPLRQAPPAPPIPSAPSIDPSTIAMAVQYLESAVNARTTPEQFAQSARSMVPAGILEAIREMGIDEFLTKVAKVPASSPLRSTQEGRNFIREVGAQLLGE